MQRIFLSRFWVLVFVFLAIEAHGKTEKLVKLENLEFCPQLSQSLVSIRYFLKIFPKHRNPKTLPQAIDRYAGRKFEKYRKNAGVLPIKDFWFTAENKKKWKNPEKPEEQSLIRLSCLEAVNSMSNLNYIQAPIYLNDLGYSPIDETEEFTSESSLKLLETRENNILRVIQAKIAYVIMAHYDYPSVQNLATTLAQDNIASIVAIHVDRKSEELYNQLSAWLKSCNECSNIVLIPDRLRVTWGTISILSAMQKSVFFLLDIAEWDYVALITGDSYPLKSGADIYEFMQSNGGKSIIGLHPLPHHIIENPFRLKGPAIAPTEDGSYSGFVGNLKNPLSLILKHKNRLKTRKRLILGEQCVMLNRKFVWRMKHSAAVSTLHAQLEFTAAPEEYFYYLASLILYPTDNAYKLNVDERAIVFKRWPKFPSHPIEVQADEFNVLKDASQAETFMFVRKIRYTPLMTMLFERINSQLLHRNSIEN